MQQYFSWSRGAYLKAAFFVFSLFRFFSGRQLASGVELHHGGGGGGGVLGEIVPVLANIFCAAFFFFFLSQSICFFGIRLMK